MALNDIQLDSSLLVDMYRNSLVEMKDSQHMQAVPKKANDEGPIPWRKHLGEFGKNILLIVRYDQATYLPDVQLSFITSILGACKLGLADVAILNIARVPGGYKHVQEKFKSSVTILFGLTPQEFEMPLDFPEFQVQPFNNCTFVHTPALEKLENDKVLKSKLWVCLRRVFGLP